MTPYSVPLFNRLARRVGRLILRLVFHLLSEVKIYGRENVPKEGPYIISVNHVSLYDPPLILAFWPTPPEAAGAIEIWSKPGQDILVRLYGCIPVHRGEYDRQLLDTVISVLKSGRPLVLDPEGARSHGLGMRRAHPGVAYIADKTSAPVIPVGVVGTTDDFFDRAIHLKRPRLEIRIGKPLSFPPVDGRGAERREALQANADQVMHAIAALVPPEYRGVYQTSNEAK
jgi:1-acyl-sn-glycerol-3-phosphate acyltransferase